MIYIWRIDNQHMLFSKISDGNLHVRDVTKISILLPKLVANIVTSYCNFNILVAVMLVT